MEWKEIPRGSEGLCQRFSPWFPGGSRKLGLRGVRCGNPAEFKSESKCGCGQVQMAICYCRQHKEQNDLFERRSDGPEIHVEELPGGITRFTRK